MQAQYQVFPYPRWRTFDAPGPVPWDAFLQRAMPLERAGWPQGREILVAGCGTGLSTLTLATLLPEAQILAVDLSRTSLAYASRKAQELGVTNVQFAVGDILHLDHLRRRFDFIECSGVLHHMQEPAEGLRALRRALAPDGVLLLSLYSARGRRAEAAAQSLVAEKGWHDDMAGLRAARAALLTLPEGHPATGVCATPDFFTRDGLHDLIFNLHESRMTPADVKALTAACELRVAAVDPPDPDAAAAFRQRHPQPAAAQDLDLWDAFEADHPTIFAHMIRVWCRPA
jgi:SAM-dependent methyltransferase